MLGMWSEKTSIKRSKLFAALLMIKNKVYRRTGRQRSSKQQDVKVL